MAPRNERARLAGRALPRTSQASGTLSLSSDRSNAEGAAVLAERGVLSIVLFDAARFDEVLRLGLTDEHFADHRHEAIFRALAALRDEGKLASSGPVCDVEVVYAKLCALDLAVRLNDRGGVQCLRELQADATPQSLGDNVAAVRLAHNKRQIRTVDEHIEQDGPDGTARAVLAERRQSLQDERTAILSMAEGWPAPQPLPEAVAVPPWPDDALPPPIAAFVDAVAQSVQVPHDLPGMVALGVMSACFAGKVRVRPFGDYCESLSVYAVAAADVGERKSAIYSLMEAPLRAYQQKRREELAPLWSDYEADRSMLDAKIGHAIARHKGKRDAGEGEAEVRELRRKRDALAKPPRADFITSDTTSEGLARLMSESGGHACLMSPEGGGIFDQLVGRYDKMPNLDVFLKAYDAESIAVCRSNREREYTPIAMPALVMVVTTQPATLQRLDSKPELRERGLLARMSYAVPGRSLIGYRNAIGPQIPPPMRDAYDDLISWALRIERPEVPHELTFGPEALEAYQALHADIEAQLRPDGALRDLQGWGNKLMGKLVRLAALFHLMSRPDDREPWRVPMSASAFNRAARLAPYLTAHALRAFGLMHESREQRSARKLMAQLARDRKAEFLTREAHRIIAKNGTAEHPRRVLDLLEGYGQIFRLSSRRCDSERWAVHPATVAGWKNDTASPHLVPGGTVGTVP